MTYPAVTQSCEGRSPTATSAHIQWGPQARPQTICEVIAYAPPSPGYPHGKALIAGPVGCPLWADTSQITINPIDAPHTPTQAELATFWSDTEVARHSTDTAGIPA